MDGAIYNCSGMFGGADCLSLLRCIQQSLGTRALQGRHHAAVEKRIRGNSNMSAHGLEAPCSYSWLVSRERLNLSQLACSWRLARIVSARRLHGAGCGDARHPDMLTGRSTDEAISLMLF